MQTRIRGAMLASLVVVLLAGMTAPAIAGEAQMGKFETLTGTITGDGTLRSDSGEHYQLTGNMVKGALKEEGERVEITGMVREEGDTPSIEVSRYKILPPEENFPAASEQRHQEERDLYY